VDDPDIQIDERGYLHLKRGDQLKLQCCPIATDGSREIQPPCGDWCPLFGEPYAWNNPYKPENVYICIDICHDTTCRCPKEKFQDLRVN